MHPKLIYSNDNVADAGLYTWNLETDTLYADTALADLFGLDRAEADSGLPLSRYVERVHIEDRRALADAIRHAVLTGLPFQESYRVHRASGEAVRIVAFGRCFRDASREPRLYAGIVFPMPEESQADDGLLWHCLSALDAANREERYEIADALIEIIRKLEPSRQWPTVKIA